MPTSVQWAAGHQEALLIILFFFLVFQMYIYIFLKRYISKGTVWEGGRRDFMVETPDQHDLSQRNKVNISSDEAC